MEQEKRFSKSLKDSFSIIKSSLKILNKDKEIVLFPILSTVISFIFFYIYMGFINFQEIVSSLTSDLSRDVSGEELLLNLVNTPEKILIVLLLYILVHATVVFFQAGVVSIINERLNGGNLSFCGALKISFEKMIKLLRWTCLASVFFSVMAIFQTRSNFWSKLFAISSTMAWNIANFFIIPTLVIEDLSIRDSVIRSAKTIKNKWGDALIIHVSLGVVVEIAVFIVAVVEMFLILSGNITLIVVSIPVFVFVLLTLAIINSSLISIYKVVLYRYAVDGQIADGFTAETLEKSFQKEEKPTNTQ